MFYQKNRLREKRMNKSNGISVLDAKDRQAATFDADAKKARHEVREGNHYSLVGLALAMAKVVSAPVLKEKLNKAAGEYEDARIMFNKSENYPENRQPVNWPTAGAGFMPEPPPYTYPHKAALMKTWNTLLATVNETTKVGVHRWNMEDPIALQHSVGDDGPQFQGRGVSWE